MPHAAAPGRAAGAGGRAAAPFSPARVPGGSGTGPTVIPLPRGGLAVTRRSATAPRQGGSALVGGAGRERNGPGTPARCAGPRGRRRPQHLGTCRCCARIAGCVVGGASVNDDQPRAAAQQHLAARLSAVPPYPRAGRRQGGGGRWCRWRQGFGCRRSCLWAPPAALLPAAAGVDAWKVRGSLIHHFFVLLPPRVVLILV